MRGQPTPGQIVILNGASRAGKSSIVRVIQDTYEIAAHSRLGLHVVSDGGHHGAIHPQILPECAQRLAGLSGVSR